MDKTKLVPHFEEGGGGGGGGGAGNRLRGRGREKRREEEEGREEKKIWIFMNFYVFLWISLDTCIDFYGFV